MSTGVLISKSEQIGKDCSTSLHSRYSSKLLKVNKFQNEFLKSSFLLKYEQKIARIFEFLEWYSSYFGRNYDFVDSF